MGRKQKNQSLRSLADSRKRKRMNDSKGWTEHLMEELQNNELEAEEKKQPNKKGKRENAKRLTNDSL
ncbi:hypothetical protein [Halobacillus naozhouensis]|uniref:Fur-regulated basic protein B n=1 Tax=Halobacillus naozhouensis TaxID=554880 RepID=A0ABY8IXC9_9BACI|nr:hypothetical protein [Halobacillus naozhouensis]WFT74893.1 hypothetical protein P9989_00185 [Halobacillus naozhouensis]